MISIWEKSLSDVDHNMNVINNLSSAKKATKSTWDTATLNASMVPMAKAQYAGASAHLAQ